MPDIDAPVPVKAPRPVVALTITLLSDGNVTVNGPIDNLELCANMIGRGLQAVADFQRRKEGARLVQAAPEAALRVLNGSA